jgi:hypothetical protein
MKSILHQTRGLHDLLQLLMVKAGVNLPGSDQVAVDSYHESSLDSLLLKINDSFNLLGLEKSIIEKLDFKPSQLLKYWRKYMVSKGPSHTLQRRPLVLLRLLDEESLDFCRRTMELCSLFGLRDLTEEELRDLYLKYLYIGLLGKLIYQFKFATNLFFCDYYKLERPVEEKDLLGYAIWPRILQCKMKQFLSSKESNIKRKKRQTLVYTVFQGWKKGLLPARPDQVDEALRKHMVALTKDGEIQSDELYDRISELVNEIIPSDLIERTKIPKVVSSKSTIEYNFENAGNQGYLRDEFFSYRLPLMIPQFVGFAIKKEKWIDPIPLYSPDPLIEDCFEKFDNRFLTEDLLGKILSREVSSFIFDENPQEFGQNWSPRTIACQPYCILEPMKVRIITKPSVGLYLGLQSIQKELWRFIKDHKSGFFRLVGRPLEENDIWDIVRDWQPGELFVSGDYSAATDNLKGEVCELILKRVLGQLFFSEPTTAQKALQSMLSSVIAYGAAKSHPVSEWDDFAYSYPGQGFPVQTNGQLMGHVLSFPILCIANYIAYHVSIERASNKRLKAFKVPPVLINGDDILFKSSKKHINIWQETVKEFGFLPSPGKNLVSDRVAQINSKLYYIETGIPFGLEGLLPFSSRVLNVHEVPFVNFGLLTGRKKQDCSRDLSIIEKKDLTNLGKLMEDEAELERLGSIDKIYEELIFNLPKSIVQRLSPIWRAHTELYRKLFIQLPMPGWEGNFGVLTHHPQVFSQIFKEDLSLNDRLVREICPEVVGSSRFSSRISVFAAYRQLVRRYKNFVGPFNQVAKETFVRG